MPDPTETFHPAIRIYARPADAEWEPDGPGVGTQLETLREFAGWIPHGRIVEYVDELTPVKSPATERPALQRLLKEVAEGDLVLTWSLFWLSRKSGVELATIMGQLVRQGVHVIAARYYMGRSLSLDPDRGILLVAGMEIGNYVNTKGRAEYAAQCRAYYKCHGLWTGGTRPPVGRRIEKIRRDGKTYKLVLWDDEQIAIVCEVDARVRRGEKLLHVAQDLQRRKIRAADGKLFAKVYGSHVNALPKRALELMKRCRHFGTVDPGMLHPTTLEPLSAG
jgi:hypothetical protein